MNRYFDNDLNELERQQFFQEMEGNDGFKHDFEIQGLCNKAFDKLAKDKLRSQLIHTESKMESNQNTSHWLYSNTLKWTSAAGVVLVILSIFLFNPGKNSPEKIFSEHFIAYENLYTPTLRSSIKKEPGTIQQIMFHYENGEFEEATKLFESNRNTYQNNADLSFYMGIAYLGMSNTERAIDLLSTIPTNSKYTEIAQWYLGLSYLLDEQYQQAKNLLMNVEYNQQEARKIIKEMDL